MTDKNRTITERRLQDADYGHVAEDDKTYLNWPRMPDVVVRPSSEIGSTGLIAWSLRDIALSLRRLVIIADAIRLGTRQ